MADIIGRTGLIGIDEFVDKIRVVIHDDKSFSLFTLPPGADLIDVGRNSKLIGYQFVTPAVGDNLLTVWNKSITEDAVDKRLLTDNTDTKIRSILFRCSSTAVNDYINISLLDSNSLLRMQLAERVYNMGAGVIFSYTGNKYWALRNLESVVFNYVRASDSLNTMVTVWLEVLVD